MHFVSFPEAFIVFSVGPEVFASTTDFIVFELAFIEASICEC